MSKIAYKNICNGFGMWIDDFSYDIDDKVTFHFDGDKTHTVKMHYTKEGRAYFKAWGERYYIDEFVRV